MLEYQVQVEKALEQRAQALLDTALGTRKAMVRVTAQLDFSRKEKTEETFDPEEPVIRSEQISEEKSGSEITGGVPGVQSNLQGPATSTASATPPSSRLQKTTNYEISKVISKTIDPVGTVQKLSVSVLVADKVIPATKKEPEKPSPGRKKNWRPWNEWLFLPWGWTKSAATPLKSPPCPLPSRPLPKGQRQPASPRSTSLCPLSGMVCSFSADSWFTFSWSGPLSKHFAKT
jgi:flagellar M-ring protein FliF